VADKPKPPKPPKGARRRLRELLAQAGGARLCYGEPVRVGDRTVIPVASVRARGGAGFGEGPSAGGGGGGTLDAAPVGFIEVGPEGARFERIADAERSLRVARGAVGLAGIVVGALAGARRLRGGRGPSLPSPRRLLGR
jgi:hypothetical protein